MKMDYYTMSHNQVLFCLALVYHKKYRNKNITCKYIQISINDLTRI